MLHVCWTVLTRKLISKQKHVNYPAWHGRTHPARENTVLFTNTANQSDACHRAHGEPVWQCHVSFSPTHISSLHPQVWRWGTCRPLLVLQLCYSHVIHTHRCWKTSYWQVGLAIIESGSYFWGASCHTHSCCVHRPSVKIGHNVWQQQ